MIDPVSPYKEAAAKIATEKAERAKPAPASFSAKPMIHELKTDPEVFDAVAAGLKTFEIRKDDRDFEVGDTLLLQRTRHTGEEMAGGKPLVYTGHAITRTVSHLLRGPIYGLREGWVILSLNSVLKEPSSSNT